MAMILEKERVIGLKVKILQGVMDINDFHNNDIKTIEEKVQDFLDEHPDILITSIKQSVVGHSITISIWYKD